MNIETFDVARYDEILARGLSSGVGQIDEQVCIEGAICMVLGMKQLGTNPGCVAQAVRRFKIVLNDSKWSSPATRAAGLRDFGLAQLGSNGVVDDAEFARRLVDQTIRVLISTLLREVFSDSPESLAAAAQCLEEGTAAAARAAMGAARRYAKDAEASGHAAEGAWLAANAAEMSSAAANLAMMEDARAAASAEMSAGAADLAAGAAREWAADAVEWAEEAATWATGCPDHAVEAAVFAATNAARSVSGGAAGDKYLTMSADIALGVLREFGSPGVALLARQTA